MLSNVDFSQGFGPLTPIDGHVAVAGTIQEVKSSSQLQSCLPSPKASHSAAESSLCQVPRLTRSEVGYNIPT